MIARRCIHCDAEIEVPDSRNSRCPVCGTDPDLPRATFDDAPPYFMAFEVREESPEAAIRT